MPKYALKTSFNGWVNMPKSFSTPGYEPGGPVASGKTSNVNLELFQMIFNNPGDGTYF
jgi:hypothetical protein